MPMAVLRVAEHELAWQVYVQSEDYIRTRDARTMLVGHGPYLVDRIDGALHEIGVLAARSREWEADYRARVRGIAVRTAVDDLHDGIRDIASAHGRIQAVRALRQRLAGLSPAQALGYVDGLLAGRAPAQLVALAVEQLVEPATPVVGTLRPGPEAP